MRNALSEILDGAIGHIGPGYHAPRATTNLDEAEGPHEAIPEPRRAVNLTYQENKRRARENDALRCEVRKLMRRISSVDNPIPSMEVWQRMGCAARGIVPSRIGQIMKNMAQRGALRVAAIEAPGNHGHPLNVYWVERN